MTHSDFIANKINMSARLKADAEQLQKTIDYKTTSANAIDAFLEADEQREKHKNKVMWRVNMQKAIALAKTAVEHGKKVYGDMFCCPVFINNLIQFEPKLNRMIQKYPEEYLSSEDQFHSAAIGPGNDHVVEVEDEHHVESIAAPDRKEKAAKHDWTPEEIGHLLHGDHDYLREKVGLTYDQLGGKTRELGYVFRYNSPVNKPKVFNRLVIGCHPDWLEMIKNGDVDELIDVQKIRPSAIANVAKKNGFDIPARCLV